MILLHGSLVLVLHGADFREAGQSTQIVINLGTHSVRSRRLVEGYATHEVFYFDGLLLPDVPGQIGREEIRISATSHNGSMQRAALDIGSFMRIGLKVDKSIPFSSQGLLEKLHFTFTFIPLQKRTDLYCLHI
jgi:hypothetical protein